MARLILRVTLFLLGLVVGVVVTLASVWTYTRHDFSKQEPDVMVECPSLLHLSREQALTIITRVPPHRISMGTESSLVYLRSNGRCDMGVDGNGRITKAEPTSERGRSAR